MTDWPGLKHANIIKTGERAYCIIAEWESMERSQLLASKLSSVIELLEYERETWVLLMQRLSQEKGAGGQAPGEAPPSRPTLSLQG